MRIITIYLVLILPGFPGRLAAAPNLPGSENASYPRYFLPSRGYTDSSGKTIDRQAFYLAMQKDNREMINASLSALDSLTGDQGQAFRGAMTMKKAGVGGDPATKLSLFKKGHKMLEAAILANPDNTEYRFLRLMIQENAPGILGYKSDEEKDSEWIRKNFKSLPESLQKTISDYSKKSKVLKLQIS